MHEDLLTCLDDSRSLEPIINFKYSENDNDDTKIMKMVKTKKEEEKNISKEDKKAIKEDEVIVKEIRGEDLKKQNRILIILAFVFTGLIVGITSVIVLIPIMTNGKQTTIPDVSGLSVSDAIKKLQDEGFTVSDEQEEISSTEIEEGKVVRTNPPANIKRKNGTEVTIYVSLGDTQISIEDYTGKSYLEIKGKLEALKLNVIIEKKDVEEGEEDKYEDGKIIEQSVKAGEKLSEGDTITLYIPNVISKYPNFTDGTWTTTDVQDFADMYDLELNIEYIETADHEPGEIYYQSKPEGYQIVAGQTFRIRVAQAPTEEDPGEDCGDGLC